MKRIIFAGFILAMVSGIGASAQNNGGYQDDVYYNASQAEKDAKADAKKQKQEQSSDNRNGADYYNSSDANSGYNNDGYNQNYSSYNGDDDAYVDYDDDSYTTRIRRFYYPMYSAGYWGSVYSPFYYDPFYANPYYGWGSWYTPGISIGIGFGYGWGGPYWSNCWGMNTWYGYGGFSSWYYPYGGYYGGWGGYWNGYYAGVYDGRGYYGGRGYNTYNYGPRGGRGNTSYNVGAYGRNNSGLRASNTGNGSFTPMSGRMPAANTGTGTERMQTTSGRGNFQADNVRMDRVNMTSRESGNINLNQNQTMINRNDQVRQENMQQNQVQQQTTRRGGFFGFGRSNTTDGQQMQRTESNRSYSQPQQRSYNPPAQQRSFTPSSPSRSFGGGNGGASRSFGGGGGRSFGGRR